MVMTGPSDPAPPGPEAESDELDQLGRSSIGRNVASLLSSQAVTWVFATVLAVVVPRLLGPTDQGLLRLAGSVWAIAQVLIGLGTGLYLTLEVAKNRRHGMSMLRPVLVAESSMFILSSFFFAVLGLMAGTEQEMITIMALIGVSVLFSTFSGSLSAVFHGLERMGPAALAGIVGRVFATVVGIAVLLAGGDARAAAAVMACSNLLTLLVLAVQYRRLGAAVRPGPIAAIPSVVRHSAAFLVGGIVITTYRELDTVVMSFLVEREALGWYAAADTLVGSLLIVPTVVMGSIFPVLGRLHQDDPDAMRDLVRRAIGVTLLGAVPIGLGTMVVAPEFAPLLYGEDFRETGQVLFVYGPVIVLMSCNTLFGAVSYATGRRVLWNTVMLVSILMTIPLDLVFVPWADAHFDNGAIGGAMAYVVTEAFQTTVALLSVVAFLRDRSFASRVVRIVAAGLVMFAVTWPFRELLFVVPATIGVIVYCVAVLAFGALSDDDRREIGSKLARVGVHTRWESAPDTDQG